MNHDNNVTGNNIDYTSHSPLHSSFNQILHGDVLFYDRIADPTTNMSDATIDPCYEMMQENVHASSNMVSTKFSHNLAFIENLVDQDLYYADIINAASDTHNTGEDEICGRYEKENVRDFCNISL